MTTNDHFHQDSLDEFTGELSARGFRKVPGEPYEVWRGAIHPAFAKLTDSDEMSIAIRPGWPFQSPALLVDGLNTNHSTLGGFVCMWRDEDDSLEWTTVDGFFIRIEEWCNNANRNWENDNLEGDAYLNFHPKLSFLATFDLFKLGVTSGGWGEIHGLAHPNSRKIDIQAGRSSESNHLQSMWFHVGILSAPPPRHLSEIYKHLSRAQRKGLRRALNQRRKPDLLRRSGGCDLILFCWKRDGRTDLLALACRGLSKEMEAGALMPGPQDEQNLILRAGPDATELRAVRAVVFGAGALGGYTAVALAQSGIGCIDVVDDDILTPGNVARHIAGHSHVGSYKVLAVKSQMEDHAPWAKVNPHADAPKTPAQIIKYIHSADIIVDATGNAAFTQSLAMIANGQKKSLVSGSLYHGGAIGRVQRQAITTDAPINQREESDRYPAIPQGDDAEEFAMAETGCSAPVNNAPPTSVLACSSRIAQVAIDTLTKRFDFEDETIDVYKAVHNTSFNTVGTWNHNA